MLNVLRWGSMAAWLVGIAPGPAAAGDGSTIPVPVPNVPVRAGDLFTQDLIADRQLVVNGAASRSYALLREQVIGKVARRALPAGSAIPLNALREPWLFKDGERVSLMFGQSGLNIRGAGLALQPGVAGETISVRNIDTGVVVRGLVRADGTVQVGVDE